MEKNGLMRKWFAAAMLLVWIAACFAVFGSAAGPRAFALEEVETTDAVCVANGHRVEETTVIHPTQTEEGRVTGVCAVCGRIVTVETLPPEAQRSESRLMGDVNGDGKIYSGDARSILRVSAMLESLAPGNVIYADLDANGKITAKDARQALRTSAKLEKAIRHSFSYEIVTAPTCTGRGLTRCKCDYCALETELTVPPNGHAYRTEVNIAPTCTEQGKTERVCTVCGYKEAVTLQATGHQWQAATQSSAKRCAVCGAVETGWTKVGDKWVFFRKDGSVPSGKQIINGNLDGQDAARYTVNGVYDPAFRGAVTADGADWLVMNGKALKVATASDRTLFRAFGEVAKATKPNMTKAEKLRACFDYCKTAYDECRPRTPHYTGIDWPVIYANDMFVNGSGNCCSYAAAFAYLAKAIGYENVYACNSGGHGWAEVDGLIYDPEWSKIQNSYTYYALSYYTPTDVSYRQAISPGLPWMHVKI